MKKIILIIAVFLLFPMIVDGKTYRIKNSEVVMSFDQQKWDVFAQGIKQDSYLLDKYGYDNVTMQNYLKDNSMYAYAIYNQGEMFELMLFTDSKIVKYEVDDNESFGQSFGPSIAKTRGVEDFQIYESNYQYVKLDYYDPSSQFYLLEYHILINSQYYVFLVRKENEFSEYEKQEIEEVIDSVEFNKKKEPLNFEINWIYVINYVFCIVLGAGIMYFNMRKSKKDKP